MSNSDEVTICVVTIVSVGNCVVRRKTARLLIKREIFSVDRLLTETIMRRTIVAETSGSSYFTQKPFRGLFCTSSMREKSKCPFENAPSPSTKSSLLTLFR